MDAKKVISTLSAVLGGLVVVAVAGFLVWALLLDGGDDRTALPEEALEGGEFTEEVLVNVHFGHEDRTPEDFSALEPVQRSTERSDLIAFTIEEMIAGPNDDERDRGLYSELELDETSESTCGGDDYAIEADEGAILIWFCRDTLNYGDDQRDSTTISQIMQTMSQFPDAEETFVFDRERNCFGDRNGENACYERLPAGITP